MIVRDKPKWKRHETTTHISFRGNTLGRLRAYVNREFPGHNIISMIVDKAVSEWLDKNDNSREETP